MVKHNNVIPNGHFHKQWARRVKTWFSQAPQKKARRARRAEKASALAPRPVSLLRPLVQCPSGRYAHKTRLGKGFTLEELKEAGVTTQTAKAFGIAVDHRRVNRSTESLQTNVARLQRYRSKLVVFPRGSTAKNGDASADQCAAVDSSAGALQRIVFPVDRSPAALEFATPDTGKSAVAVLRKRKDDHAKMKKAAKAKAKAEKEG